MDNEAAACLGSHRLVHFDLKRAPIKVTYLEKLFPLLHSWGATGLLLEWEDTFPYEGDLAPIGSLGYGSGAPYTQPEVDRIHQLAQQNNLIVIPLVQTFGHLEFVLRHEKWHSMREVENYPSSLCASHSDGIKLVTSMVDQVISKSPKSLQYFHIGADEVWHLGMCFNCSDQDKQLLFLSHVTTVLRHLREHYPHIRPIMWDDMLRSIDARLLSEYGLADLVDPMVWIYDSASTFHLPDDLWEKYTSVFKNIWVASAFKGATGSYQILPILEHHLGNHIQWINTIKRHQPLSINLCGIGITGWSRYDHYATLCELLPTALPTLALCLRVWKNCGYDPAIHKDVATSLGYIKVPLPLTPYPRPQAVAVELNFPGWKIAVGVEWFANLNGKHCSIINSDQVSTWMNPWQIKHGYINPMQIDSLITSLSELIKEWDAFEVYMTSHLTEVYYEAVIEEWMYTHVHSVKSAAKQLHMAGERQLSQVTNKKKCKLCRDWLTKLVASTGSRRLRNIFLERLIFQVKNRHLLPPFDNSPPAGPLFVPRVCDPTQKAVHCTNAFGDSRLCKGEDISTSWSDSTTITYGAIQPTRRYAALLPGRKVMSRPHSSPQVGENSSTLNEDCSSEDALLTSGSEPLRIGDDSVQKKIEVVNKEVSSLRDKVSELQTVNEEHRSVLTDYRKALSLTLADLSNRLATAVANNSVVSDHINKLKTTVKILFFDKIKKLEMQKDCEVQQLKRELQKDREKQLEEIKKLNDQLSNRDLQLMSLSETVKEQCSHMEEEVMVLKKEISNNATNSSTNLHLKQKIASLKKKIFKLEKRNEKMTIEYERRIKQAKKDYNFRIQSMKLEMGSQRCEASFELETAMNALEQKYKSMLSEIDYRYFLHRQMDAKEVQLMLSCGEQLKEAEHHGNCY